MSGRRELLAKIEECERAGRFHEHNNPPDLSVSLPVDGRYRYLKKGFRQRAAEFFRNLFIVRPFTLYLNKIFFRTKVYGRGNLKNLKSAVAVLNHVNIFDCLAAKHALRGRRVFITAAPFNNRRDFLGRMMRAGGMAPFGGTWDAQKNFQRFFADRMKRGHIGLFYPEQAMWWCYEKPRPYLDGAFHYAARYNAPILPMFIAFTLRKKLDKEGLPRRRFHFFILPPICPDPGKAVRENAAFLKAAAFEACKEKYEAFYGRELEYLNERGEGRGNSG
jgi:1-acyl-sn-glycerol-3-phosphate acyltransferase